MWQPDIDRSGNAKTPIFAPLQWLQIRFYRPEHWCTDFERSEAFRRQLWAYRLAVEQRHSNLLEVTQAEVVAHVKSLYPEGEQMSTEAPALFKKMTR